MAPSCGLTEPLRDVQNAFCAALEKVTLADLTGNNTPMAKLVTRLNVE
ncbi:MAG: hypothetical protein P8O08_11390 [Paracoccaceae bacterium]|nr:hypothetical protein [Paracoccaceae bacterium]MDG2404088.1 hypothetical protein [Paracoccaceae bacterium]